MDSDNAAQSPPAWHLRRPLSLEITPIEYEYYMKKAHEMRAASMASMLVGFFARLKRVFARAHPAQRRHEPVLIKRAV